MSDARENGFAYAGPPGNRIYSVGKCMVCSLALFNDKPEPRHICFFCERDAACTKPHPTTTQPPSTAT